MDEEKVHTEKLQAETKTDMTLSTESKEISIAAYQMIYKIEDIIRQNPQLAVLVYLLLLSGPLYIMFRHSPAIPDLHFSECFVAMVYIANMLLICIIIPSLLCFSFKAESYFDLIVLLLAAAVGLQLLGDNMANNSGIHPLHHHSHCNLRDNLFSLFSISSLTIPIACSTLLKTKVT